MNANALTLKLSTSRWGRTCLHLGCVARGGNMRWHLRGIRRELFSARNRFLFLAAAVLAGLAVGVSAQTAPAIPLYSEPFRPQFHFTPEKNWMNDPNGLVFYQGEYHLFYQYNPYGDKWGHMSWAHAVSPDLIHWQHLPLALAEENGVMIFSGSAVVDWNNTSGFSTNGKPPLVAIYAGHYTAKPLQNENIAYSNDRGRTWTKYAGNPVVDIGAHDFRDPKVFWYAPAKRWIMVVALSVDRKICFYSSPDLKQWQHLSDFGPAAATNGVWECPDLFPLAVDGDVRHTKWVLTVNVGSGAPAGGTGVQYFIGHFDGATYTTSDSGNQALWGDFGPDYYAAVSWSDIPKSDGRRIWMGWMNNWQYGQNLPTSPWRSAMSVPRELGLVTTADGLRLVQKPVSEFNQLRKPRPLKFSGGTFADAAAWLRHQTNLPPLLDIEMNFTGVTASSPFAVILHTGENQQTSVACEPGLHQLIVDRRHSGLTSFDSNFSGTYHAPLRLADGQCHLRLLLDTSSLETFAQNGETVLSTLIFPDAGPRSLSLTAGTSNPPHVSGITIHSLESAWRSTSLTARSPEMQAATP